MNQKRQDHRESGRWKVIASGAPYLVIALVTVLVFGHARRYGFLIWDDQALLAGNEWLNPFDATSFVWILRNTWKSMSAPLVPIMWGLLATVTADFPLPASAGVFHLFQLTLHIATSWLVFATLNHLLHQPVASLFGSLLFSIHPIQVGTVVWITQTSYTAAGFFCMGAILCFLHAVDAASGPDAVPASPSPGPFKSRFFYVIATLSYLTAVLSNPIAIGLPLVLAAIDIGLVRRSWEKAARWMWPWFLVSLAVVVMAQVAATEPAYRGAMLWLRPAMVLDIFAYRSLHIFLTAHCCPDYGHSFDGMLMHGTLYWSWFFAAIALVFASITKHRRVWLTIVVSMILSIVPRIVFLPTPSPHESLMTDQYAYLWMFFPALALAFWLATHTHFVPTLLILVVLIGFALNSYGRASHYETDQTLLIHTLQKNPQSSKGYRMVAETLVQAHQFDAAIRHLDWALDLGPSNADIHMDLATVFVAQGDVQQALVHLERALELEPHRAEYANAIAWCLATSSDPHIRDGARAVDLALEACEQTGWQKTGYIDTLAAAYAEAGDFESAIRAAQMAIDKSRTENSRIAYTQRLNLFRYGKAYHIDETGRDSQDANNS